MTRLAASTETVVVAGDAVEVVVLPGMGARLHRLRVFGHELLRTPNDLAQHVRDPFFWGAYVMAPWCNRLDAGRVGVEGRVVDLQPNFRDGTAIHGQVYLRSWDYDGSGPLHTFSVMGGGDGWPWEYAVAMRIAAAGHELRIEQEITNVSTGPMPAGLGLHPWFRRPVHVRIAGDLVFDQNEDSPPAPRPVDGGLDLRRLDEMAPDLDATWARLGDPPIELYWPDTGVVATIRCDARTTYVTAASPSDVDAVAVEPQTHAPQGLRRLLNDEPGALDLLPPADDDLGGSLSLNMQMTFDQRTVEDDQ